MHFGFPKTSSIYRFTISKEISQSYSSASHSTALDWTFKGSIINMNSVSHLANLSKRINGTSTSSSRANSPNSSPYLGVRKNHAGSKSPMMKRKQYKTGSASSSGRNSPQFAQSPASLKKTYSFLQQAGARGGCWDEPCVPEKGDVVPPVLSPVTATSTPAEEPPSKPRRSLGW